MPLDPNVVKALMWGFYDRGTRELRTPDGPAPVRANEISTFIDTLIERGTVTIVRAANGAPTLRVADAASFSMVTEGLEEILERAQRTRITGVMLFGNQPGSEWKMLLDNTPCALDPATRELVALTREDLDATLPRFDRLSRAVTIEDANLQFMTPTIARSGGRLYAPGQTGAEYLAIMPGRMDAANVLAALTTERLPDPQKLAKLHDLLVATPALRAQLLPGVEANEVSETLEGIDRASFRDLVEQANSIRSKDAVFARDREQVAGRVSPFEGKSGATYNANDFLESFDHRKSRYKDGVATDRGPENFEQRTFGEQMAERARAEVRDARRGPAVPLPIEEEIEADRKRLEERIQTAKDRNFPEALLYREKINISNRMSAQNAMAWVASITQRSPHHIVVSDQAGRYDIVAYDKITQHCIGVKNHNAGAWRNGAPDPQTMKNWSNLSAPITISAERGANGSTSGLKLYGENPETLRKANIRKETAHAEAAANGVLLIDDDLARDSYFNEYQEDLDATMEYARMVAVKSYGLPSAPKTQSIANLEESKVVESGGNFETLAITYAGPILATGKFVVAQYVEGQIQPHEIDALGCIPQPGEEIEISYPPKSGKQYAAVVRNSLDAEISKIHQQVQAPLNRALRSVHIAAESQQAIDAASELHPEITWSVLSLDEQDQSRQRSVRAPVLHATSTAAFVPDIDNRVIVTFDPSVTGRHVEAGNEAVLLVGGGQNPRLLDVVRTQERDENELADARLSALDVASLSAIDKVGIDILTEALDCRKNDLIPLAKTHLPPGSLMELAATTNHHVYMTARLNDSYVGFIRYPKWDEYGKCTALAAELQSVGYGRTPYPGESSQIQPLLRSERDDLKLPPLTPLNVTIRDARVPQVLVRNEQTGAERAATRPFTVQGSIVSQVVKPQDLDVTVVGLDLSSKAEERIRTILVLDDTQTNTADLAAVAVGSKVELSGVNRDLSVTLVESLEDAAEMKRAVFLLEREFAENQAREADRVVDGAVNGGRSNGR